MDFKDLQMEEALEGRYLELLHFPVCCTSCNKTVECKLLSLYFYKYCGS